MRLPRWLRPVHDLPSRSELDQRVLDAEALAARGVKEAATSQRLRDENRFAALAADLIRPPATEDGGT